MVCDLLGSFLHRCILLYIFIHQFTSTLLLEAFVVSPELNCKKLSSSQSCQRFILAFCAQATECLYIQGAIGSQQEDMRYAWVRSTATMCLWSSALKLK